ncbi:MAG: zinc-ribbon domain-containing protein [Deltaproteobacteria bacterium]|nr:zinc-ribbon domain-containing protein [Deltaproteobacteria bacterium]
MDVKCQQCGVEYEFDDARVTDDGVTVKCTNCGHIFKVKREVHVITEPVVEPGVLSGDWMVRQPSGNVFTFKELTTLQRWIVERKVARDDEISKTGKTWKRLGDIAELASFFQVVEDASRTAGDIHAAATLPPTLMPTVQPAQAPAYGYPPGAPSPAVAAPTIPDAVPVQPSAVAPSQPQLASPAAPVAPGYGPATALPPAAAAWQQPVAPPRVDFELDDEDPVREWQRPRRWPWVLLALVLLICVGVGGLFALARPTFDDLVARGQRLLKGELPPDVAQAVARAQAATRRDVIADLEQAAADCRTAVGKAPDAAEVLAAQAAVEIALAAAQRDLYDLYRQQIARANEQPASAPAAGAGGTDRAELKALANRAGESAALHFKLGFEAIQKALAQGADDADAALAAADYYRLNSRFDQAQQMVERALAQLKPDDDRVRLFNTLIQAAQPAAQEQAAAALVSLVRADPQLGRAHWALVQVRAARRDLEGARAAAAALLAAVPGHERAKLWLAANAPAATQPATQPESQPAAQEVASAPPAGGSAAASVPAERPASPSGDEAGAVATGGYAALVAKANRLREIGNTSAALKLYNLALASSPGQPEAMAGQGWCYLDQSQTARALSSFQAALDADADYGEAHMGLAETWRARGNKEKAVAEYRRYVEIGGAEIEIAKRAIEELTR